MRRVLVTAVGGNVGQGVIKALRAGREDYHIVGIDMEPLSAGYAFVDSKYVVPATGTEGFGNALSTIIESERVEAIYPCSPTELLVFAEKKAWLESTHGVTVLVNGSKVVQMGSDKLMTADFLRAEGFAYPATARADDDVVVERLIDDLGFPLLMKPRIGATSRNVFLVRSIGELRAVRTLVPDMVVQRYLGNGDEYTAGSISDADGNVRAIIILRRVIEQGTTYRAELVRDSTLEAEARAIVGRLGASGPCNLQFKIVDGKLTVFEVNPRFSGTTGMRYLFGFNDAEMAYDLHRMKMEVSQPELKDFVVLRYWNEVLIPDATFDKINSDCTRAWHHRVCAVKSKYGNSETALA